MAGRIRYMTENELRAQSVERTVLALADLTIKMYHELDASKIEAMQRRLDQLHARIYELDPSRDRWNPIPNPVGQMSIFTEANPFAIKK